jgi:hypothetical protein
MHQQLWKKISGCNQNNTFSYTEGYESDLDDCAIPEALSSVLWLITQHSSLGTNSSTDGKPFSYVPLCWAHSKWLFCLTLMGSWRWELNWSVNPLHGMFEISLWVWSVSCCQMLSLPGNRGKLSWQGVIIFINYSSLLIFMERIFWVSLHCEVKEAIIEYLI